MPIDYLGAMNLLREARDLLQEALDQHIYDADNGEAPGPDCAYTKLVQEIEQALDPKLSGATSQPVEEDEDEIWWTNHYKCPECEHEWEDRWTAQVDDDCPQCGLRHISPYRSDDDGEEPGPATDAQAAEPQ